MTVFPIKKCFFFLNGFSLAMFDCQSLVVLSRPGGLGLCCLGSATDSALLQTARGLVNLSGFEWNQWKVMDPHGYDMILLEIFWNLDVSPLLIRHDLVWQGTQITHTASTGLPLGFHWASTGLPLGFHWASTGLPLHLLSMHQKVQRQESGAVSCVNPRPQYVMHSFTLTLKIHLDLAAQPQSGKFCQPAHCPDPLLSLPNAYIQIQYIMYPNSISKYCQSTPKGVG